MKGDLTVIGLFGTRPYRIAASATRFDVGEPLYWDGRTLTGGAASANAVELMDADGIVLGTDTFAGVALRQARPFLTGTLTAQETNSALPVPEIGKIEGGAETTASIDTSSELINITGDAVLIDYNSTGASDGGPLYKIKEAASANTSAFTVVTGNISKGTLQVVVDARAYRIANTIS